MQRISYKLTSAVSLCAKIASVYRNSRTLLLTRPTQYTLPFFSIHNIQLHQFCLVPITKSSFAYL